MKHINDVFVIGEVASEIKITETTNSKVANFQIKIVENIVTKEGNEKEIFTFMSVSAWGYQADNVLKMEKGDVCMIKGKIQTSNWEDDDGKKRSYTKILATSVSKIYWNNYVKHFNQINIAGQSARFSTDNVKVNQTQDGEIKFVSFSVGTTEYRRDENSSSGFNDGETTWHSINLVCSEKFFKRNIEDLLDTENSYKIVVNGRIKVNSYEVNGTSNYRVLVEVKEDGFLIVGDNSSENEEKKTTPKKEEKPKPKKVVETKKSWRRWRRNQYWRYSILNLQQKLAKNVELKNL